MKNHPSWRCWHTLLVVLLIGAGMTLVAAAKEIALRTDANVMVELTLRAQRNYADPFNEVTLDVTFIDPRGRELRVPGFWAGGDVWKVRYASPVVGTHTFHSECSEARDKGLHGVTGKVEIKPYTGQNPLYAHGPLHVAPNRRYLEHTDHTPFFWLGDTWWMGLCHRLHWPGEFKQLTADRKDKGFNVIQIVAGLYPDMPAFDPRGANEAGFPWETNYARIRPEYFDAADQRLGYLVEQGFTPCIVGAWGYFMPWMGVDKVKAHWRYLIARYGAWPVVWCAAGEANLPWYLAKGFPYDDRKQVHDWTEVLRFVRETDPFGRPLTLHPSMGLTARHATDDAALLDFDMLQTPHGQREAVPVAVKAVRDSYAAEPVMPVIDGEASYEMLNDSLPTEWTRRMFWLCLMNGAAGHTYGANGIWQCNRPGQPHGNSPQGGTYGKIPWNEAMHLPGSQQLGFGKKMFEQFPWQRFQPHPEWSAFANGSLLSFDGCQWIWFPEGNPAQAAPVAKRYCRRTFVLPAGKAIERAQLRVSADDSFTARLNGETLGASDDWHAGKQFENLARLLKPGTNVLAIVAENKPANVPANPAGLIACLEIRFADGEALKLVSDATWRCAKSEVSGWDTPGFDDAAWAKAMTVGRYGDAPWGQIGLPNEDAYGPQTTGIPGVVRVIYVPESQPIVVRNLDPHAAYAAAYFDPVSGTKTAVPAVHSDDAGLWTCPPPVGISHDWVLMLESPKSKVQSLKSDSLGSDAHELTLADDQLAWHFDWSDGRLRSTSFENKLSGRRFALSGVRELGLNFSAATDRVAQPFVRAADFEVRGARLAGPHHAVFDLRSSSLALGIALHVELDGPTRRKWVEVTNQSDHELLLLDVELDDFTADGAALGSGERQPVFLESEVFAAIEHPAGVNQADKGRIQLSHFPGRRLAPGATFRSLVALVSVAKPGQAVEHFLSYLQAKSVRPQKAISICTPFGINNQWGGCPTLDDEQTLDVLRVLEKWQKKGVRFDYFTLDTGWVDPASDLTRFRPTCFPKGPGEIVRRVNALGMNFGLWFATSWAAESCWDYPPALTGQSPVSMPYRLGYPDKAHEGRMFCFGSEPYFQTLKSAVLYHVRENHVRWLKFDGGNYTCDSAEHGHLPGKYSVEPMFTHLIDIADSARAVAPDVRIMWYYGCSSPFWALHGDFIFESGLPMEGSATSAYPTLYYRDSVTLMQDQVAQYARNIPPLNKDSLGVWLADNRWGNFMGKERWREGLVMDLGRGSLLFPNLWGDVYHLSDDDVDFLARLSMLAKQNDSLFLHRRKILGDPARNEVYGYAHCQGARGFLFLNNAHFATRRAEVCLDAGIGLEAKPGTVLQVVSHFPERARLLRPDGARFKAGDTLGVWLRPFEVLMLEVTSAAKDVASLPLRSVSHEQAAALGTALTLKPATLDGRMDVRFVDANTFAGQGLKKKSYAFETTVPSSAGDQPILAVAIRLRKGDAEWRHAPTVVQIVQVLARIGDQDVQLVPVPDGRQFGNTQSYGCSWVLYKIRLNPKWSGQPLKLAVHACLPDGVEAQVEAWEVQRWWQDETRPAGDAYYNDAPS
jgi:transposase